jgi:hypothetical protein
MEGCHGPQGGLSVGGHAVVMRWSCGGHAVVMRWSEQQRHSVRRMRVR